MIATCLAVLLTSAAEAPAPPAETIERARHEAAQSATFQDRLVDSMLGRNLTYPKATTMAKPKDTRDLNTRLAALITRRDVEYPVQSASRSKPVDLQSEIARDLEGR